MPELPEVETMAADLRAALLGARVADAWLTHPSMLRHPDPADFPVNLIGRRVTAIGRRAKTVLLWLDGDLVLTIAPVMTGHLAITTSGSPRGKHDHLGIGFDDGRELRLTDTRRFARFGLWPAGSDDLPLDAAGRPLFAAIGPEPWDASLDDFAARLRRPAFRRRAIKAALLDQALLAGVGNIYADEALWAAHLHPLTPAGALTDGEAAGLLAAIRAILEEGIARRGSSVRDYAPPDGGASMAQRLAAYGRGGQPCLRCGTTMARGIVAGRGTSWCPSCQPAKV